MRSHSSFFTLHFKRSDSGGIQTHNLLIRSQMLYSVELRSQTVIYLQPLKVTPAGFKPTTF